jgi:Tfp pilus assembly protein PilF
MLVTRTLGTLVGVSAVLLSVLRCGAMDVTTRESDLGAGPIVVHQTACLIANRTHSGTPCPEPRVDDSNDVKRRVTAYLARAWFFIDMQDLEKGRSEADLALAVDPNDVPARHLSARLSVTIGDIARAEKDVAIARREAPDDPDIDATYAMVLETRPAPVEALQEFAAIIDKHPHHLFARLESARLLMQFGRYQDAVANLDFIINEREPNVGILELRAEAHGALGRPMLAAADLQRAIQLAPNRTDLMIARADIFARIGLADAALHEYDALLATDHGAPVHVMFDNDRATLLAHRAYAYICLQRFDKAADDMMSAIKVGGTPAILRAEVMLRRNGFPNVPIDGQQSPALRNALSDCFARKACFQQAERAARVSDWRR